MFLNCFLFNIYPEAELLGHTVVPFLLFLSYLCAVFCSGCTNLQSPYHLLFVFFSNHSDSCEVMSHCGLELPFSEG